MQAPRSSARGTIVFALVAVVALGSTVVATGLGGGAERHLADARAKMRAECTGVGTPADPCVKRTPFVLTKESLQRDELAAADAALRTGNRATASIHLAGVLENATTMDRQNTIIASLLASSLIDEVSKRVDADPSLLDQPYLVSTLRHVSLRSAKHPLASERLEVMSRLSRVPSEESVPTGGFLERAMAESMDDVDASLRKMETAVIAKDNAACESAAANMSRRAAKVTVGSGICAFGSSIVAGGDRLADLRARANARAHTRTVPTTRL